jgi:hypothetical protein
MLQTELIECCVLPLVLPHAAAALKGAAVGPGDTLVPLQQQRGLKHSPYRPGHITANQVKLRQPVRDYLGLGDPARWQQHEGNAVDLLQADALRRQQQQLDGRQQREAHQQQRAEGWCGPEASDTCALMQCGASAAECLVGPEGWWAWHQRILKLQSCDVCGKDVAPGQVRDCVAGCISGWVVGTMGQDERILCCVYWLVC